MTARLCAALPSYFVLDSTELVCRYYDCGTPLAAARGRAKLCGSFSVEGATIRRPNRSRRNRPTELLLRVDLRRPDPQHMRSKYILAANTADEASAWFAALTGAAGSSRPNPATAAQLASTRPTPLDSSPAATGRALFVDGGDCTACVSGGSLWATRQMCVARLGWETDAPPTGPAQQQPGGAVNMLIPSRSTASALLRHLSKVVTGGGVG